MPIYGQKELKQSALIQRIIYASGFQNTSPKATPAEVAELPADVDRPETQECGHTVLLLEC
eukprot:6185711-Ditylum_brightwellii.AAC.2